MTSDRPRRLLVAIACTLSACGTGRGGAPPRASVDPAPTANPSPVPSVTLSSRLSIAPAPYRLTAPVQREVAVASGRRVLLAGGLDASGTSSSAVSSLDPRTGRLVALGEMSSAFHDAAGAMIGGRLFVFGGGVSGGTDLVRTFEPATGRASVAGHLPLALSDLAVATVGDTVYLVGGFDGTSPRREIYATSDGQRFERVGMLPVGLRYPAVTAVGSQLVVAGGRSATAVVDTVFGFDTTSRTLTRIGRLPGPTTNAVAFTLGDIAEVAGGRDARGGALNRIVAVDPATGHIQTREHLPRPISDAAAVGTTAGSLILGGARGTPVDEVITARLVSDGLRSSDSPAASGSPAPARNVYAAVTERHLAPKVASLTPLVYVPNNGSNTVTVIDPATYRIVRTFAVGMGPQHVSPSWDMRHLYVGNTYSNTLTQVDPRTGRPTRTISVPDPYNLYFTPDGSLAIDVAERLRMLIFFDPNTWARVGAVPIPWAGADHLDFSADGRYLLISTEYSGRIVKVSVPRMKVVGTTLVGGLPVDVKLAPDGSAFFVANQGRAGVSVIDPRSMRETSFIPTGAGAHGFCVSRDTTDLYVSNRLAGTISVIDFAARRVVHTWNVGGSPDMLQVTADGKQLWVSNRYDATVSVISTSTGRVLHTIPVGTNPHGLTLFPQPGRYSIGHNGVYR